MPNHDYPTPGNAFNPDYLNQLAQHDDPVTADEAMTGGFWRVVPVRERETRRHDVAAREPLAAQSGSPSSRV